MTQATTDFILAHPELDAPAIREALAVLAQNRTTARAIPKDSLGPLLRKRGVMGIVLLLVDDVSQPAQLRAGLLDFRDQMRDVSQLSIDTTDEEIATKLQGLLEALSPAMTSAGIDAVTTGADIYALGGGLAYDVPTEDQIVSLRSLATLDASAQSLRIKINNGAAAVNALIAAFQARIDAGDVTATAPSGDELKAAFAGAFA